MQKKSQVNFESVQDKIGAISNLLGLYSSRMTMLVGSAYMPKSNLASFSDQGIKVLNFSIPKLGWTRFLPVGKPRNFIIEVSNPKLILELFHLLDEAPLQMLLISTDFSAKNSLQEAAIKLRQDIWILDKMREFVKKLDDGFIYEINTDSSMFDGIEEIVYWSLETPLELLQAAGITSRSN